MTPTLRCPAALVPHFTPSPEQGVSSQSNDQSGGVQGSDTDFALHALTGKTGSLVYMAPEVSVCAVGYRLPFSACQSSIHPPSCMARPTCSKATPDARFSTVSTTT